MNIFRCLKRGKFFQEKILAIFVSVLLIIFVGAGYYLYNSNSFPSSVQADPTNSSTTEPTPPDQEEPVSSFVFSPGSSKAGEAVSFDALGSSDPDGNIVGYAWIFGDGSTGTGVNPSHSYVLAGSYTVSLTVTDNDGLTGLQTKTIIISPSEPTLPTNTFGVVLQYYLPEENDAYHPDMWTLIESLGASHISSSARRWAADEAALHGIKCVFSYTSPPTNPKSMADYFGSSEALIAHLSSYNISQYREHPGVFGHILTGEPWGDYNFDPLNPDQATLNLISVLRSGVEYIKSQDPTHPVWVALNPAGASVEDSAGQYLIKRKAWISLFIDFCDILDYHYYGIGDSGGEWWRNSTEFRQKLVEMLDTVIIPGSKGKPIIIGEMGCPSAPSTDWQQKITEFNESQQAEYFRIYGEETKARGIFVYVFKLIDATPWDNFGLFNTENNGVGNIPKLAASLVREYVSIE
jgi:PKD repeat protein